MRRVKAGETLYRAGDKFDAIYAVRSGFFKTVCVEPGGAEVVLAFPMGGDLVGLDGLDSGRYPADVVALDTSHVAVLQFARLSSSGASTRRSSGCSTPSSAASSCATTA